MRHEKIQIGADDALSRAIFAHAADSDRTGEFPGASFDLLRAQGHVGFPPVAPSEIARLLRLLAAVGRGDLNVGRIYEGHVNALLLVGEHGTPEQRNHYGAQARRGDLFGVWNTDLPSDPLLLEDGVLAGAKNFASGVDGIAEAIVTVTRPEGRRMIVAPVAGRPVDRSWWTPMGMRASGSHVADFSGLRVDPSWMLGEPDAYVRQPWFSGGAIRFAAVQTGGMHAVFDVALDHLRRTGRDCDPYQRHRIARMGISVETAYAWLDCAAAAWMAAAQADHDGAAEALVATANATRSVVEASALAVLEEAERGVGAAGMIAPHPLERLIRDLRTYLRQPNPDGALAALATAIADGIWSPGARS